MAARARETFGQFFRLRARIPGSLLLVEIQRRGVLQDLLAQDSGGRADGLFCKPVDEGIRTAGGEALLQAKDLTLEIGDLDQQLSRYESSQNLNLVDVGAFFLAGPVGTAVTKGYDFASILRDSGGHSQIRTLVSKWNIERGVAQAKDVAMVTKENRIALTGELDFVNRRFKDVTVALVDARGCARAQQKINGPFGNPEVEKPNVLMSVAGPARNLLRQAQGLTGRKCAVFYSGSVAAPH